jgi:hypothetical protein
VPSDGDSPQLDGHSLTRIIADAKASSDHKVLHFAWTKNWAVRKGDWKLICKWNAKNGQPIYSLHNLEDAQPEVKDYAQMESQMVQELISLHEEWEKDVKGN